MFFRLDLSDVFVQGPWSIFAPHKIKNVLV